MNGMSGKLILGGVAGTAAMTMMMEVVFMPMLRAAVFGINGPGMIGAVAALMAHLGL
jgi:hypothetical protein